MFLNTLHSRGSPENVGHSSLGRLRTVAISRPKSIALAPEVGVEPEEEEEEEVLLLSLD